MTCKPCLPVLWWCRTTKGLIACPRCLFWSMRYGRAEGEGGVATTTRSTVWVDAGAGATITRINSQGSAAAIVSDLLAVSNADVQQDWEGTLSVNSTPTPTAALLQSVTQRVSLVFTTTAPGVLVTLILVAPKSAIFLADGRTVDLSNTDVATLAADCIGKLCTEAGDTATALIAGYLTG